MRLLSVRERKLVIGLATVVFLAALVTLRVVDLRARKHQILDAGDRTAANLARMLGGYVQQTFAASDAALRQLALHSRRIGGATAPPSEWLPALQAAQVGLTGVSAISVLDANGIVRQSTQPTIIGTSRRDQFVFTQIASGSSDGLVADVPSRLDLSNRSFVIPLGRKLTSPADAFDGVIVASFLPDSLREFFGTVDVGRGGSVTVFHDGGFVLFREPSLVNPIGEQTFGNPLFAAAKRVGGTGLFRGRAAADGPVLRTAFQALDQRLIVAVSLSEQELLAGWNRGATTSLIAGTLLTAALIAFLLLLFRQMDVRESAEQALIRSQRLESLGQLTGGVAHDFNNLLTVILGNVSLMKTALAHGPITSKDESIVEIERASKRAAELTRKLLAFARRQALLPRVVDLGAVVASAEPMIRRAVGEGTRLELVTSSDSSLATVDPVQLDAALLNVCLNAREAMATGGSIVIETDVVTLDQRYARTAEDVTPGRYSMVSVSDNGEGIPPENIPRLFEPFFTTKTTGKGTGLGLAMVYGFVKQSGGHIKVASEVGRGTTVKLYFPEATGIPAVSTPVPDDEPLGHGEVILLVEDEPVVRGIGVRLLKRLGYSVIEAKDGPTALALVKPDTHIDLLLTDVMLPGNLTGVRLAEEIKRQRPDLPVLFASGYSREIIELGAQAGPSVRFLAKPYDRRKLAQAVHEALTPGHAGALGAGSGSPGG